MNTKPFWKYVKNNLITLDQGFNTLFGGDPDETISSRCGKRVETCKLCFYLCKLLNKIDNRHCKESIEKDEGRDAL